MAGFTNKFFLGVAGSGFMFMLPPLQAVRYTDEEMVELAALIIAMKPELREKFDEALERMQS